LPALLKSSISPANPRTPPHSTKTRAFGIKLKATKRGLFLFIRVAILYRHRNATLNLQPNAHHVARQG
jgi:hypothetical protein